MAAGRAVNIGYLMMVSDTGRNNKEAGASWDDIDDVGLRVTIPFGRILLDIS